MITSKQNSFIKKIKSLSDKKFRDEYNLYIVEGVKPVKEAISTCQKIVAILGTERGLSSLGNFLCEKTEVVSLDVFKSISSEVSPQGVMAVICKPQNVIEDSKNCCILLDGVSDPANVGAIIRTASASNYNDIYLTNDSADPFSPKAVRASMSCIFRVNIHIGNRSKLLEVIKKPIVVADMDGENVFDSNIKGDFCLCIGNEGKGVSDEVISKAKYTVSIPMENGVESLNASVSAGILMYNLKNPLLNKKEK